MSSGDSDPYWYEWIQGLKYVVDMLQPDSLIQRVIFQDKRSEKWNDIVVQYKDTASSCVQVKHTRVGNNMTYSFFYSGDENLLEGLFKEWKQLKISNPEMQEFHIVSNLAWGLSKVQGKCSFSDFAEWINQYNPSSDYRAKSTSKNLDSAILEWVSKLGVSTQEEIHHFLCELTIVRTEDIEKEINNLQSKLKSLFGCDDVCAARYKNMFLSQLLTWSSTRNGKNSVDVVTVYESLSVQELKNSARLIKVQPSIPFFRSRILTVDKIRDLLLSDTSRSYVYLTGKPGEGKTSIVTELYHNRSDNDGNRLINIRFYTFKPITISDSEYEQDMGLYSKEDLWRGLLNELRYILKGQLWDYKVPFRSDLLSWLEAKEHVLRICDRIGEVQGRPCIIAIDGLDHAARYATPENKNTYLNSLPSPDSIKGKNIKFLISGQPQYNSIYPQWFDDNESVSQVGIDDLQTDDIKQLLPIERFSETKLIQFASVIRDITKGNTLSTIFAVQYAEKVDSIIELRELLTNLKIQDSLYNYYDSIWLNASYSLDEEVKSILITYITVFPENLTAELLFEIINSNQTTLAGCQAIIDSLYPMLISKNNNFYPLHNDIRLFFKCKLLNLNSLLKINALSKVIDYYKTKNSNRKAAHLCMLELYQYAGNDMKFYEIYNAEWIIEAYQFRVPENRLDVELIYTLNQCIKDKSNHYLYNVACAYYTLVRIWENNHIYLNDYILSAIEYYDLKYNYLISESDFVEKSKMNIGELKSILSDVNILYCNNEKIRAKALFGKIFIVENGYFDIVQIKEIIDKAERNFLFNSEKCSILNEIGKYLCNLNLPFCIKSSNIKSQEFSDLIFYIEEGIYKSIKIEGLLKKIPELYFDTSRLEACVRYVDNAPLIDVINIKTLPNIARICKLYLKNNLLHQKSALILSLVESAEIKINTNNIENIRAKQKAWLCTYYGAYNFSMDVDEIVLTIPLERHIYIKVYVLIGQILKYAVKDKIYNYAARFPLLSFKQYLPFLISKANTDYCDRMYDDTVKITFRGINRLLVLISQFGEEYKQFVIDLCKDELLYNPRYRKTIKYLTLNDDGFKFYWYTHSYAKTASYWTWSAEEIWGNAEFAIEMIRDIIPEKLNEYIENIKKILIVYSTHKDYTLGRLVNLLENFFVSKKRDLKQFLPNLLIIDNSLNNQSADNRYYNEWNAIVCAICWSSSPSDVLRFCNIKYGEQEYYNYTSRLVSGLPLYIMTNVKNDVYIYIAFGMMLYPWLTSLEDNSLAKHINSILSHANKTEAYKISNILSLNFNLYLLDIENEKSSSAHEAKTDKSFELAVELVNNLKIDDLHTEEIDIIFKDALWGHSESIDRLKELFKQYSISDRRKIFLRVLEINKIAEMKSGDKLHALIHILSLEPSSEDDSVDVASLVAEINMHVDWSKVSRDSDYCRNEDMDIKSDLDLLVYYQKEHLSSRCLIQTNAAQKSIAFCLVNDENYLKHFIKCMQSSSEIFIRLMPVIRYGFHSENINLDYLRGVILEKYQNGRLDERLHAWRLLSNIGEVLSFLFSQNSSFCNRILLPVNSIINEIASNSSLFKDSTLSFVEELYRRVEKICPEFSKDQNYKYFCINYSTFDQDIEDKIPLDNFALLKLLDSDNKNLLYSPIEKFISTNLSMRDKRLFELSDLLIGTESQSLLLRYPIIYPESTFSTCYPNKESHSDKLAESIANSNLYSNEKLIGYIAQLNYNDIVKKHGKFNKNICLPNSSSSEFPLAIPNFKFTDDFLISNNLEDDGMGGLQCRETQKQVIRYDVIVPQNVKCTKLGFTYVSRLVLLKKNTKFNVNAIECWLDVHFMN